MKEKTFIGSSVPKQTPKVAKSGSLDGAKGGGKKMFLSTSPKGRKPNLTPDFNPRKKKPTPL